MDIIESAPQEHTKNDNLTHVDGVHQNNRSGILMTTYEFLIASMLVEKNIACVVPNVIFISIKYFCCC